MLSVKFSSQHETIRFPQWKLTFYFTVKLLVRMKGWFSIHSWISYRKKHIYIWRTCAAPFHP